MRKKMGIVFAAAACFVLCVAFVFLFVFSHSSKERVKFTDELKLNAFHDIDGATADDIVNHKLVDTTNWAMSVIDETFAGHGMEMSGEERRGVEIAARNLFYELFNGNVLQRDENGKLTDLSKAYVANVLSEAVVANVDGMDEAELLDAGGSMYTKILDINETIETVKKNEETLSGLAWDINDLMVLLSGNPASGIDENEIARKLRAFQTNLLTLAYEKNPTDGNGIAGSNGLNGADGMNGLDGMAGVNGSDGNNGMNGIAGNNGLKGIDGMNGLNGMTGGNGTNGIDGTKGLDGTNGLDGASGSNGMNGIDGKNGNTGSAGRNGVNGIDGKNGQNGTDGKAGQNGSNGKDGKAGTNGTNGSNGTNGINGTNGKNGTNGIDGKNGTNGADGKNGTNGTNGTNGKDGTSNVETVRKLQNTVDELSKAQVEIISDMKAAMNTIDSLTKDVAVGEKSDSSIKKDVSAINESLGKAEANITETGVKLASLEKSITADYEKKIDSESKSLVSKIDSTVSAAKEAFEVKLTGLGDVIKKNRSETDKLISDTKAELVNADATLKKEFTSADERIKEELSGEVADLRQTIRGELSETNSDVSVLKESIRDYMMSSEGHAKVDVLKDIVILKHGAGDESEGNTVYWELSGGKARAVISSPYLKDCMSVQIYYRYQENISPVYDVDDGSGVLTITVNEGDLDHIDRVEIQSMLIIHNADESTLNEDSENEIRNGYTSENTPDIVQMDHTDIDADGISHESGDTIIYTAE